MTGGHVFAIALGIILILCSVAGCCQTLEERRWQRMVVEHGAAHYDPMTAEFTWNDPVTPEKKP